MAMKYEWKGKQFENKIKKAEAIASDKVGLYVTGEAMIRCPVKTGNLAGNLNYKVIQGTRVRVGTNVVYAASVEFGTSPHIITVKTAKVLTDGKTFFGKSVKHPGTKAQPFLRPAIFENKKNIQSIYKKSYAEAIKI